MSKLIWEKFTLDFWNSFSFLDVIEGDWVSDKIIVCMEWEVKKSGFDQLKNLVSNVYFDNLDRYPKKEEAFENVIRELNEVFSEKFSWLNIIIWLYADSILHVTQAWEAESYLIRNWRVSVVCESSLPIDNDEDWNKNLFDDISSWNLLNDDILIVSSKRLLKHFTSEKLVAMFSWVLEGTNYVEEFYFSEQEANALVAVHVQKENIFEWRANNLAWFSKNIFGQSVDLTQNIIDKLVYFIVNRTNYSYETIQKSLIASIWVIIIVFFISIIAFSSSFQNTNEKMVYEKNKIEILKIDKLLEVAESRALMQSIDEANEILDEVEKSTKNILDEWVFRQDALLKLEKVQNMRDDINKITRIIRPEEKLLFDLTTVDKGTDIEWFVLFEWAYFVYSATKFYKVILNKFEKQYPFVEGEIIKNVSVMKDKKRIIIMSEKNTLYEFDWEDFVKVNTSDEFWWKNYTDIKSYSRFLYLLDNGQTSSGSSAWTVSWDVKVGQVWKYSRWKSGFLNAQAYTKWMNFSNALSLAIDWSIYVLNKDWQIIQFYSWKEVSFSYVWDEIKDANKIFTDVDYLNIYLFDEKNNKIISIEKTREWAKLKRQYVFENLKIEWFSVDKDERELVVTWENKLYKMPL